MTPPIGFRTDKTADDKSPLAQIRPVAAFVDAPATQTTSFSRAADYAYRIAAVTAGLILLATVM
ncbi:hypothetical protein [Edaphobacter albus]|uniref:hypothetical protein n=1 Tax=Edaphobacter sp. 4G125 TaxID=2763071 RepID=UPI001649031B|nr:hypothetical protein [Edaphobacter sp. 4G125]QNI36386.1 hypothetical protein H7846_15670 [Edaphobacter sp. 4G125]